MATLNYGTNCNKNSTKIKNYHNYYGWLTGDFLKRVPINRKKLTYELVEPLRIHSLQV